MHPAVDIHKLQRLPVSQRRVAMAACRSTRSFHNLKQVEELCKKATDSEKILFLPVFYINLDPAHIPTPGDLEYLQPDTRARIACASLALEALFDLMSLVAEEYQEPDDVGPALWPRVWPWTFFMHEYRDYLQAASVFWEPLTYTRFLLFVSDIYGPQPIRGVISSTPGFRVLMARTWTILPRLQLKKSAFEPCLWFLASIIGSLEYSDPVHFAEMVEGAGGNLDELASLALQHINVVVSGNLSWEVGSSAAYMCHLAHLIQAGHSATQTSADIRERFIQTLRRRDFIPALVVAMNSVLEESRANDRSFLRSNFQSSFVATLELLERLFDTPMGYRWLPAAIEAHLLTLMAGIATEFSTVFDGRLQLLLTKLLPDGLLYYHVVAALDNILDDVAEIWSSEELEELEIFDDWSSFRYLAEKRVQLLHSLQSTRSCDNLECGKIQERSCFRRCMGCKTSKYCNKECQIADWKRGGHRNHCGSLTTLILAETNSCTLGFRERQFMRAVVRDDFTENTLAIYQHQVKFIANIPANRFYTLFDYTCNPVQISVESVVDSPISHTLQGGGPNSEWMNILARAEASHGRMHLHVAKVPEGSLTHVWVIPLRTNSPQIHEALFQLGNSVSADYDEEEIVEEVGKNLENAVGLVVETY
ncbi:hypothetical protein C8F04DRAFT_1141765 [Mycena alexandri]|uniref:MYND-type domain-containing protein n=1 Tax=Mycena alexandri TaxID=1745969 RepID=A0AAD6S4Q2_9AGAR|nr:hypothetical protein C8F04DRAFT_1141765 [Mycena alexandri]